MLQLCLGLDLFSESFGLECMHCSNWTRRHWFFIEKKGLIYKKWGCAGDISSVGKVQTRLRVLLLEPAISQEATLYRSS